MNQFPALPLPNAEPDVVSEDYNISFVRREFGAYSAVVRNEYGDKVDEVREPSFAEAYDVVSRNYPQAAWTPKEGDDEAEG